MKIETLESLRVEYALVDAVYLVTHDSVIPVVVLDLRGTVALCWDFTTLSTELYLLTTSDNELIPIYDNEAEALEKCKSLY